MKALGSWPTIVLWIAMLFFPFLGTAQTTSEAQCGAYRMDLSGEAQLPSMGPGSPTFSYGKNHVILEKLNKSGGAEGTWKLVFWHSEYRSTLPSTMGLPPREQTLRTDCGQGRWLTLKVKHLILPGEAVIISDFIEGNITIDIVSNKIMDKISGHVFGTISGKMAKMKLSWMPGDSPEVSGEIQLKKGSNIRLAIINPSPDYKITFDDSNPGRAVLQAKAQVTPAEYADQVVWKADDIEGTAITFDPPQARGSNVQVRLEGLPAKNNQFGPHRLTATLNVEGCTVQASVTYKLYYLLSAKNNPGAQHPNWLYYWKQTPAARPKGQTVNIEYGGRNVDKCRDAGVTAVFIPGFGLKTVHVCDLGKLGPEFSYVFPLLGRKTKDKYFGMRTTTFIDTFAVALIHEFEHYLCHHNWREGKSDAAIAAADKDEDGIPDDVEIELGFNPKKFQTYFADHKDLKNIGGDEEWLCYEAMYPYKIGSYDRYDWACPGKQWSAKNW